MVKKDLGKILSRTLLTYGIILSVVFLLKICGLNYFGLATDNHIIIGINNFITKFHLENIWYAITLYINGLVVISITCNDNTNKMKRFVLYCLPLFMLLQIMKTKYNIPFLFVIIDLIYLFILSLCYIKFIKRDKIHKYNISNYWLFMGICFIYQFISLITRGINITNNTEFIQYIILNFDYILLTLLTYKLYFIKGGVSLWEEVHSYSLDLLISLRKLPTKLHQSYQNAKPKNNEERLANKIYIVLFWLYNFFTVAVVLLIATLNDTFIECIFILSSFWINKAVFGKAFHLKKASTCFVVSTLSYYVLNRLTWDIGISFLVPIILGIALSYITSKLMARKENIYLYRGIPENDFYKLINKVTDNKEHINICKDFYVYKEKDVKISYKYNYSVPNIKRIKKEINDKIKELQM